MPTTAPESGPFDSARDAALPGPSSGEPRPPIPRSAHWAAHAAALVALPSGLWRIALILGFHAGYTDDGYEGMDAHGWGGLWMAFLTVATEALGLLTLALVRPWGEAVPRWVPRIGGVRPAPLLVARVGTVVAIALVLVWTQFLIWWAVPHDDMTAAGTTWVGVLYLPLIAWGPLVWFVVRAYRRHHGLTGPLWRRRAAAASAGTSDQ